MKVPANLLHKVFGKKSKAVVKPKVKAFKITGDKSDGQTEADRGNTVYGKKRTKKQSAVKMTKYMKGKGLKGLAAKKTRNSKGKATK